MDLRSSRTTRTHGPTGTVEWRPDRPWVSSTWKPPTPGQEPVSFWIKMSRISDLSAMPTKSFYFIFYSPNEELLNITHPMHSFVQFAIPIVTRTSLTVRTVESSRDSSERLTFRTQITWDNVQRFGRNEPRSLLSLRAQLFFFIDFS